jgi:NAD(P)-dependent dehydrogenase (short-subunit alcohol dehydrogenase family)
MKIQNARAVITGGASGLGHATARHLVAQGARVVLLDVQEEQGRAAAEALGGNAHFLRCDVASETEVDAAMAAAAQWLDGLNLLVNCAGIIGAGRVLGKQGPMSGEFFTRVVHINLIGTFLCDKAAANLMQHNAPNQDGERGLLVHTASIAAFEGQIGQAAYSATKAALAGMTLPIARELARFGIRCIAIAPGIFHTPMIDTLSAQVQASLAAQIPFPHRLGKPAEFAQLVAAAVEIPMLNGETIRLDGAVRMQPQ